MSRTRSIVALGAASLALVGACAAPPGAAGNDPGAAAGAGAFLRPADGDQHGSALIGKSECVDRAVADYLIDLRTPPAGARCAL